MLLEKRESEKTSSRGKYKLSKRLKKTKEKKIENRKNEVGRRQETSGSWNSESTRRKNGRLAKK